MKVELPQSRSEHLRKSVLIVEDQRLVAADLAVQLRNFGYKVVGQAVNGAEAVAKARELTPDLVMMDIHLGGAFDGAEAARRIRAESRCAILFLTAYSDEETLERAKLAEPSGYLVKPVTPAELRCAVEVALHKSGLEQRRSEGDAEAFGEQLAGVRRRVHELEHAYSELESFRASLTHDLRNPLQVIRGATEMLERMHGEQLSATGRAFLGQVGSAADRMMERLEALLEHAQANHGELERTEFSLSRLVEEVWAELAPLAPRARCVVQPDLTVYADRALLRRVLENLLSNAIKFSVAREQPKIEFGAAPDLESPYYYVRDNGLGFDMRVAEGQLFVPYGRLHPSGEYPGTGLGLAGSRRILERHGGKIWAHAVPNEGATFCFVLPTESGATR